MVIKTFFGDSLSDALKLAEDAAGRDALIVDIQESPQGAQVLVEITSSTLEKIKATKEAIKEISARKSLPAGEIERETEHEEITQWEIQGRKVRKWEVPHYKKGASSITVESEKSHLKSQSTENLQSPVVFSEVCDASALTPAKLRDIFRNNFQFAPATITRPQDLVLVGAYGVGKTSALIKFATNYRIQNLPTVLINADYYKTAASRQLAAYADALQLPYISLADPSDLPAVMLQQRLANPSALFLVDTPGINLNSALEISDLRQIIEYTAISPTLVHSAGYSSCDNWQTKKVFRSLGCQSFIYTKTDCWRSKIGVLILSNGSSNAIPAAGYSESPMILEKIKPIDAELLYQWWQNHSFSASES